jgi:hypothetical protein
MHTSVCRAGQIGAKNLANIFLRVIWRILLGIVVPWLEYRSAQATAKRGRELGIVVKCFLDVELEPAARRSGESGQYTE